MLLKYSFNGIKFAFMCLIMQNILKFTTRNCTASLAGSCGSLILHRFFTSLIVLVLSDLQLD